jgi:hypothetical protein
MAQMEHRNLKITKEELEKVQRLKERHQVASIDPEWYFIGQFGMYYGFEGVMAILDNKISMEVANKLMLVAQKIDYKRQYNDMQAVFVGSGSVSSKKPAQTFKKLTKDLLREASI